MSYNCFAEKVAKGPKRHVVSKVLQKAINIEGATELVLLCLIRKRVILALNPFQRDRNVTICLT